MDNIKTIQQFIDEKINGNKFCYFKGGLRNYSPHDGFGKPIPMFFLKSKDFCYNKNKKEIVFDIGSYADKNLLQLLNSLFIPLDEMSFDVLKAIKDNDIKLILINNVYNQGDEFFDKIYHFFKIVNYIPEYKGIWNPR